MILYFANRKMEILGHATTNLPEGFVVIDDAKTEEIDTGVATFSCRIGFDEKTRLALEEMTEVGNYLLRSNGDENEFYSILDAEIDTKNQEIYVYAEDAGLELLNEIVGAFEADESHTIDWYFHKYISDSGFHVRINEVSSKTTRKLSWEGESTVTERLASIANSFGGCELSYSFAVEGMEVTDKFVDIHKERGKSIEEQLRLNRDIDRIIVKKSVANLATALRCTGGTPKNEEKPITLRGYNYDDGDFYVGDYGGSALLMCRSAVEKWGRVILSGDWHGFRHIEKPYSYDTTSQKTLCSHAVTELKKICKPEVNYEIEINKLAENIKIGDRINIVDDDGELYLSARILVLETSITGQSQKATLGEYLIKSSGISDKVEELSKQFENIASRVFYTWIAYADDENGKGISLNPSKKKYLGTAVNRSDKEVDISDPTIFTWAKIKEEDLITIKLNSSQGWVFNGLNKLHATVLTALVYRGGVQLSADEIAEIGVLNWYKNDETTPSASGSSLTVQIKDRTSYRVRLESE